MLHQLTPLPLLDKTALAIAMNAAQRRAGRVSHLVKDPACDRDDHRQDILVDLISRANRFDPARGSWSAFVNVVTRNASLAILARPQQPVLAGYDVDELMLEPPGQGERAIVAMIDARMLQRRLPEPLRNILASVADTGSVTDAQRASGRSAASFYRALRQLRLRLIAAGLSPAGVVRNRSAATTGN